MTNFCSGGGILSGDGILSPEPFDFGFETLSVTVACNHLSCRECQGIVRVLDGFTANSTLKMHRSASAEELQKLGAVRPLAGSRVYLCSCPNIAVRGSILRDV